MAETETKTPQPPKQFLPVCPYCGLDPCIPEMLGATFGKLIAKIFVCPNRECRKIFNVDLTGER